jgi:hypothetical protein
LCLEELESRLAPAIFAVNAQLQSTQLDISSENAGGAHAVVFFESSAAGYQTLWQNLGAGIDGVLLDAGGDGVREMAAFLANRGDLTSIGVVAHGSPGTLSLGTTALDVDGLESHSRELAVLGAALAPHGELDLWSCDAAAGQAGTTLLRGLASATGAGVAAADHMVGARALGGTWQLDVKVAGAHGQTPSAAIPFSTTALASFASLLDLVVNSGTTYTFNSNEPGSVYVRDNPNPPPLTTTFNVVGGSIGYGGGSLYVYNSSVVNISAGTVGYGSGNLNAFNSSVVNISGGTVAFVGSINAHNASVVNISGGSIGYAGSLNVFDSSVIRISSGSVAGAGSLNARGSGVIIISGTNFNLPYGTLAETSGNLSGTLMDGSAINVQFATFDHGTIVLKRPPQPTITSETVTGGPYNGEPYAVTAALAQGTDNKILADFGDPSLSYTYYAGTTVSGTGSATPPVDVGTFTVVSHWTSNNSDFLGSDSLPATFTIAPAAISVSAENKSKAVGVNDPQLTFQITSGTLYGGDAFTGSLVRVPGEAPGSYAIQQGTLALSADYALTFIGGTFTIVQPPAPPAPPPSELSLIYTDPYLLTNAYDAPPVETDTDLSYLQHKYGFREVVVSLLEWQNYRYNSRNLSEKWIQDAHGLWYFILPSGKLYQAATASKQTDTLIADLASSPTPGDVKTANFFNEVSALDNQYGFSTTSSYSTNWGGQDEKWILGNGNQWYFILKNGEIHKWNGESRIPYPEPSTLVATVTSDGVTWTPNKTYQYPTSLTDANDSSTSFPASPFTDPYSLELQYGFASTTARAQNWGGLDETWLKDSSGSWYYILPHGALYQWTAGTNPPTGQLISLLDPSVYDNPFSLTNPAAPALPLSGGALLLISSQNRTYLPDSSSAGMSGGWAPNQKGIMAAADGSLWFTVDEGRSFWVNAANWYYKLVNGTWEYMGATQFDAGVSHQNGSSIMVGDTIYTYATDEASETIQECSFSTSNLVAAPNTYEAAGATQVIETGKLAPGADAIGYDGAAVSPNGTKVVWWSEYDNSSEPGAVGYWVYMYRAPDSAAWSGPFYTRMPDEWNRLDYVYAKFEPGSDTNLVVGGELFAWTPTDTYAAGIGTLQLGGQLSFRATLPSRDVADLWIDANGGVHVVAESHSTNFGNDYTSTLQPRSVSYYFLGDLSLADVLAGSSPVTTFASVYRARFVDSGDYLYLITATTDGGGVRISQVAKATVSGEIDWTAAPQFSIPDPSGLLYGVEIPNAIWVESSSYQTNPVSGLNFVFTGMWPTTDMYLWSYTNPT